MTIDKIKEVLAEMGCMTFRNRPNWFVLPGMDTNTTKNIFLTIGKESISYFEYVVVHRERMNIKYAGYRNTDFVKVSETDFRKFIDEMILSYKKCEKELLILEIENESK